ncbi:TadE/TadG family type IV pilus assembly protein [Sphingobium agri]|uniref:Pilus assembly protein n=1 Tax=Sphingobium agri TaxID=2933566 RepID=A0ABT0DVK8_9SPHN|nr:TadE/TadG family type IV pilus assembly protein [Sphingobium agri]MCK0531151.1 pilus assembly protein [Sphingobium agri]
MRHVARLIREKKGASAAEFALILPLLLILLLGIIDVGRLMWTWNEAEKATQMGARYAVATDMIPNGLASYSFAINGGLSQGDAIPESSFGGASCVITGGAVSCSCKTGATCPGTLVSNNATALTAFNNIVDRMRRFMPQITSSAVQIDYDYSGLGYAGDPNGSDVSPLVRVSIRSNTLTFRPILLSLFGASVPLPSFSAALTMEDGQGSQSN